MKTDALDTWLMPVENSPSKERKITPLFSPYPHPVSKTYEISWVICFPSTWHVPMTALLPPGKCTINWYAFAGFALILSACLSGKKKHGCKLLCWLQWCLLKVVQTTDSACHPPFSVVFCSAKCLQVFQKKRTVHPGMLANQLFGDGDCSGNLERCKCQLMVVSSETFSQLPGFVKNHKK